MNPALSSAFEVNQPRTESDWHLLLLALVDALSTTLERTVHVTGFHAADDNPAYACWAGTAYLRICLSPLPLLELCGAVMVTVNVGENAAISTDLLLFSNGIRVRGPAGEDLFHLGFTEDLLWVPRGWMFDDTGEWEGASTLEPTEPSSD